MRALMISAMNSSGGKTVLTCGLLAALKARGFNLQAFKCGPDYIDPMFHSWVLGVPSRNLDLFLQGEAGVRRTLGRQRADLALIEGAMGFYDGRRGTDQASAWAVAKTLDIPVILAVRPQGASLTLAAQIRGLTDFRNPSHIAGLPTVAECGGFLYLQKTLEDEQGVNWPMAGVLPGTGYRTDRLRRFGYKELNVEGDSLIFRRGETVPAHEFHYWGCTEPGAVLTETLYAAVPHLHFGGELPLAERFVERAVKWREEHER